MTDRGTLSAEGLIRDYTVTELSGAKVLSYLRAPIDDKPILVLLHGYPQTSFIWRKLLKEIPLDWPLFIPDLPGYGKSTKVRPSPTSNRQDKRAVGLAILEALLSRLGGKISTGGPIRIILCGHDRGSRICHRLAVDFAHQFSSKDELDSKLQAEILSKFELSWTLLLDTVPDEIQYGSFASPSAAVGTFHWPFLANVKLATAMITAYGPERFCCDMHKRWISTRKGLRALESDGGLDVYCRAFENPDVVEATCEDYAAGAGIDIERQIADQKSGAKVRGNVDALYSATYLGSRYDVEKVWKEWVEDPKKLTTVGIGNGAGHFLAEEAPQRLGYHIQGILQNFSDAISRSDEPNWSDFDEDP